MTHPLDGIDLVVFDKDGTLIEFHAMWGDWAARLATDLEAATGLALRRSLDRLLGIDPGTGRVTAGGFLAATPMARIRDEVRELLAGEGADRATADAALDAAWRAPDPVDLAHPVTDLVALCRGLRASGRRIGVATSDDRAPTERTLAALGLTPFLDAVVCADDGLPVKPAGDAVIEIARVTGIRPARTAVVGDSVADLAMGRAAGAGRCFGVLTGVATSAELAPFADAVFDSVEALRVSA